MKRYRELMEDLHDVAVVAERRVEEPMSSEEVVRRLKENGVLLRHLEAMHAQGPARFAQGARCAGLAAN
jgi:Ni,Fe-hydrogenase III large subunit